MPAHTAPVALDDAVSLVDDAKVFGLNGSLVPRDVAFDPSNAAHLSRLPDGRVRFRLVTEPGVTDARVTVREASGIRSYRLFPEVAGEELAVWSRAVEVAEPADYSLAYLDADERAVYLTVHGVAGAVERLDRWQLYPDALPVIDVPAWSQGTTMYQIFPDRFANADRSTDPAGVDPWGAEPRRDGFQGGDLLGIVEHLDHLERLGIETIYLNPVVTSPSNHRYDASDYHHVDPVLGGDEAFHALRAATRERGMRLVVDLSINHCHPQHASFVDVRDRGEASPYWRWFRIEEWPLKVRYRPHRRPPGFEHFTDVDAARFGEETGIPFVTVEDDGPFIETTYDSWYGVPSMPRFDLTNDETRAYLLDVARHWLTAFDADGIRMDVARYIEMDVWREARPLLREAKADAYLLCEIFGDGAGWLQGDAFDGVMNYVGQDLIWSFCTGDLDGRATSAGVERMVASLTPEALNASQLLLGSHDVPRFLTTVDGDRDLLHLAIGLQFTLPGSPSTYYGDEVYVDGGDDPENRRAFPWDAGTDTAAVELIGALAGLRRAHPALRSGSWQPLATGAEWLAFERRLGDDRVVVVANRGAAPMSIEPGATEVLLGDAEVDAGVVTVGPCTVAVLA